MQKKYTKKWNFPFGVWVYHASITSHLMKYLFLINASNFIHRFFKSFLLI